LNLLTKVYTFKHQSQLLLILRSKTPSYRWSETEDENRSSRLVHYR